MSLCARKLVLDILEALERAWKEDSGVRVVEHQTVRGDSVATLVGKK